MEHVGVRRRYTIGNGVTTFVEGECTDATPAKLLRHGSE